MLQGLESQGQLVNCADDGANCAHYMVYRLYRAMSRLTNLAPLALQVGFWRSKVLELGLPKIPKDSGVRIQGDANFEKNS